MVLQRNAEAENPLPHEMYEVGCAARVLKMLKFPDNTVRVLVEGLWRIASRSTQHGALPVRQVRADAGPRRGLGRVTAMMRNAQGQFQEIIKLRPLSRSRSRLPR